MKGGEKHSLGETWDPRQSWATVTMLLGEASGHVYRLPLGSNDLTGTAASPEGLLLIIQDERIRQDIPRKRVTTGDEIGSTGGTRGLQNIPLYILLSVRSKENVVMSHALAASSSPGT